MNKNSLICLLCMVCVLFVGIVSANADPVTVAINPDSKPFKYLGEDGEILGIDVEIINAIAGAEEIEIEMKAYDFDKLLDAVASCEADLAISALTWTEERAEKVWFSEPYIVGYQSAYIRVSRDSIESLADEEVKVVGVKGNTTAEDNVAKLADEMNYEVRTYADYPELFAALENDEIDAAVSDEFLAKQYADQYGDFMTVGTRISEEPYAIAVCPGNDDLMQKINEGLETLKENGTLDYIVLDNLSNLG